MKFYKLGIICGILHQEYQKMHEIKVNACGDIKRENFNSIEIFFLDLKNSILHFCPNMAWFLKKNRFISGRIKHLKIIEGRGFRGGLNEKMRRMWLGMRNCCGCPSSPQFTENLTLKESEERRYRSHFWSDYGSKGTIAIFAWRVT